MAALLKLDICSKSSLYKFLFVMAQHFETGYRLVYVVLWCKRRMQQVVLILW